MIIITIIVANKSGNVSDLRSVHLLDIIKLLNLWNSTTLESPYKH